MASERSSKFKFFPAYFTESTHCDEENAIVLIFRVSDDEIHLQESMDHENVLFKLRAIVQSC